jgi:hypothetical protein
MDGVKMYYYVGSEKRFKWQCIFYSDGSNPYIAKNEKEFNKLKNKYNLLHVGGCHWKAIV